jgi:lipoprotein-releasing system permease protein
MFAALAVMLCTAMVIIVISVMGGFLDMLRDSAKQLTGDVSVISQSLTGFAYYEDLTQRLEALPEVEAVTSVVNAFGMINLYGQTKGVNLLGIDPESFTCIVPYEKTLQWSGEDILNSFGPVTVDRDDLPPPPDLHRMGMTFSPTSGEITANDPPGVVIGIEVNPWHVRDENGRYSFDNAAIGQEATLTVLPLTERGAPAEVGPTYAKAVVVNEFKSGLYDIDKAQVYLRFDVLQKLLGMQRSENPARDPETGELVPGKMSVKPARVSEVVVKGAPGYTLAQVDKAVRGQVAKFIEAHPDQFPPAVRTWEERHAHLIGAVQNEKGMVTFLFVIISIVAVVMVATTFYMTVLEKTRDIGVLRAVGASQTGIIGMFLGYGLAVGALGAFSGLLLAIVIVTRLNEIQFWLAHYLGVTAHFAWCAMGLGLIGGIVGGVIGFRKHRFLRFALVFAGISAVVGLAAAWVVLLIKPELAPTLNSMIRFEMWNPQLYFFDRIPARIAVWEAGPIVLGAILASVVGALIPAIIAAELDPVEALRYE